MRVVTRFQEKIMGVNLERQVREWVLQGKHANGLL